MEKQKEKGEANLDTVIDFNPVENKMKGDIETLKVKINNFNFKIQSDLQKIKAGRLSPDSFSRFFIVAYGQKTPITELG